MSQIVPGSVAVSTPSEAPNEAMEIRLVPDNLSVREVGSMLNVSDNTVRRLCERGQLDSIRIGRMWRIRKSSVMALLGIGHKAAPHE